MPKVIPYFETIYAHEHAQPNDPRCREVAKFEVQGEISEALFEEIKAIMLRQWPDATILHYVC